MIAPLLLTALLPGQDYEVAPRPVAWEVLSPDFFDHAWTLPDARRPRGDLVSDMRELSELSIARGDETAIRFGDLVAEVRRLDGEERAGRIAELFARDPRARAAWSDAARALLLDEVLVSDAWDCAVDDPRDGILMGPGWELRGALPSPWRELDVTPRFEQAAALFHADLATIKEVENDYRTYPEHVGADYEEIFPVEHAHLFGEDDHGRPFRFVAVHSRCDLPFPFTDYTCDLRVLNRVDSDGVVRTDIYSPSSDFHFLAGCDLFLPVRDSGGAVVAYLVVRDFGFDLDGVPDGAKHRQEAMRGTIGNLKREAELRSRGTERPAEAPEAVLAGIRVRGRRTR